MKYLTDVIKLGDLIDALSLSAVRCEPDTHVTFDFGGLAPRDLYSYRGFYEDLAISYYEEPQYESIPTVEQILSQCKSMLGETIHGYKGGQYLVDSNTRVWAANWGECPSTGVTGVQDLGWIVIIETEFINV